MGVPVYIGVGVAATVAVWVGATFNRFIGFRNRLREAWSGIDVQLKRRHDLVPSLVECVRGYRDHERTLLENVTQARSRAVSAQGVAQAGEAETGLARQLRSLFAVAEAYPDLKADQNFRQLSANLVEIEDQLQYARRYYNGVARDFNILAESFPSRLVAALFGFKPAGFFEIESVTERQTPEVRM